MMNPPRKYSSRKPRDGSWLRYAGLGTELMGAMGISAWLGYRLDRWLGFSFPLFLIVFPLAAFGVLLWKLIRSSGKKP